jgi:hypothetical protein
MEYSLWGMRGRRGHRVYIGANGSIEIRLKKQPVLQKPGADGRKVWEQ